MNTIRGSVALEVAGLELLARNSLNAMRNTSLLSSVGEFQEQERDSVTDKEWNWKILRDQFLQKNLEDLYRKYDDKLMKGYQLIFMVLLFVISSIHIMVVAFVTGIEDSDDILAVICYSAKVIIGIPILLVATSDFFTKRFSWINIAVSIFMLTLLVVTDVSVPIFSTVQPLRPSYITFTLLACYVFMPIKNNYLAGCLASIISLCQLAVLWTVTYRDDTSKYKKLCADLLFLLGANFLGLYYRLMNEVVKRRSFLDRRACVEVTLKLNYEKDQEERLMLSILPEHITSAVKKDIWEIFMTIQSEVVPKPVRRIFSHLYIEEHKNVSILYADIVNYTMITTTLQPRELVETLNELFGRFDEASEENDVLRIKFLGDCYYCVSGVPKHNPQHAKSCVDLGLEMISIIAEVREKRRLNIDMRIGVHTGDIMCGLIGIRKWQFDIWSKDVTIANKMESTGKAGKVHITKTTLVELNDDARDYVIEPNYEARIDALLTKHKIETFLVSKLLKTGYRRASVGMDKWMKKGQKAKPSDLNVPVSRSRRTTAFMDNNLVAYRQMLKAADDQMADVIDKMSSGIARESVKEKTINRYTLLYHDASWELSFISQPDPLFKYFIGAGLFVLILMMGIQGFTIEALEWKTLVIDASLGILLIVLQPLMWTQFLWRRWVGPEEPKNRLMRFLYNTSSAIVWNATARSVLYVVVSSMLSISSLINLAECDYAYTGDPLNPIILDENCIAPWHLSQACTLALMISFLFSRVFFLLKWTMGLTLTGIYMWLVWDLKSEIFMEGPPWNKGMDARISQTLSLVFLTMMLHWTDRQTEYRNRLDHRWKRQLTIEQDEAYTMKLVNNMLLQNILPAHVAEIYLNTNRNPAELYHEEYECVSVIFASLTYKLGIEDDSEVPERMMLRVLDELISDFDRLLLSDNSKMLKVEKIKMAGWTYMAACGLEPGRRETRSTVTSSRAGPVRSSQVYEDDVVVTMLHFAADMMKVLRDFNRSSFQTFEGTNLKIGISHGPVVAGVVGSLKPLYDIWGDAVNMASRMDSTGQAGKIQVTENTAIALDRQGILTQYRGQTQVKGVSGLMRTFYVPLDKDFNIQTKNVNTTNAQTEREISVTRL